jgi:hypothetical protein
MDAGSSSRYRLPAGRPGRGWRHPRDLCPFSCHRGVEVQQGWPLLQPCIKLQPCSVLLLPRGARTIGEQPLVKKDAGLPRQHLQ